MSKFNQSSEELFDKNIYWEEEDQQDPLRVFRQFFNDYRLHEIRDILWMMVETCITTDNAKCSDSGKRDNLLTRYRHFEELLEAERLLEVGPGKEMGLFNKW